MVGPLLRRSSSKVRALACQRHFPRRLFPFKGLLRRLTLRRFQRGGPRPWMASRACTPKESTWIALVRGVWLICLPRGKLSLRCAWCGRCWNLGQIRRQCLSASLASFKHAFLVPITHPMEGTIKSGGRQFRAYNNQTCPLRLALHTEWGPVVLEPFRLSVMPGEDDTIFLGGATLKRLGIDVYGSLAAHARQKAIASVVAAKYILSTERLLITLRCG